MNLNINKHLVFLALTCVTIPSSILISNNVFAADAENIKKVTDKSTTSEDVRKANAVLTVNTVKPQLDQWSLTQIANGSLWAWQDAVIASEIGGLRITKLFVDVGSKVKRGQKLAQLSQDIMKVDVAQKQALVAQAKAELAEATANAKRVTEAKGGNAFSEQQTTQYLIALDKSLANLASAEAQLKNQQIRLKQTNIIAVDDGVISARSATLGAVVQVGSELFRLVRQNRLEWRAELMAEQLMQIQAGQKVHLTLAGARQIEGTVRVKAPTIDPVSRKAIVYVDITTGDSARPGMFARGEIVLGEKEALTVPESAVVLRDGYAYVFEVNNNDHRVMQRKIVTGRRAGKRVEILDGLNQNAVIVATGGAFLNSGDTVRVAEVNSNKTGMNVE